MVIRPLAAPTWRAWLLAHYWSAPTPPSPEAVAAALGDAPATDRFAPLPLYTLWTDVGVAALAAWIRDQGLRRVVEVGAGDGCLTRWLQRRRARPDAGRAPRERRGSPGRAQGLRSVSERA